jgi:HPr kinase/phosphorylase
VAALTVRGLLASRSDAVGLPLELVAGAAGLERVITSHHIQKTGLALAGFDEYLQAGRVLVFGESEVRYLESLDRSPRLDALAAALTRDIPCILVTGGWEASADLTLAADRYNVPLLRTPAPTPLAIAKLTTLLEDRLAVREIFHGVLLDILGLGVLIVGESGIGKSECALDLVVRGHRLVADDAVEVRRRGELVAIGTCPDLTRHHMEVRGLGVINVRDLFGIAATRASKRIELVVQLERWDPPANNRAAARPDAPESAGRPAAMVGSGEVIVGRSHDTGGFGRPAAGDGRREALAARSPTHTSRRTREAASTMRQYDRLGLDSSWFDLLGLKIPLVRMPVAPGRSLAILVEVAARNQILRMRGRHAARDLAARLDRALRDGETTVEANGDDDTEDESHK